MSVQQVYLSWANSVLCEVNSSVDQVGPVQDGRILCEIIDILAPDACLMAKLQESGNMTQRVFIQTALDHMKNNGVKIVFSTQDIIDGDIKSLLDVMWLLILNYGIHFIGQNSFQRTVGVGKKALLDWCQGELEVAFDAKDTLTHNLCTGGWFTQLLHIFAGSHIEGATEKVAHLYQLLQEIEERYGIKRTIISPNDVIDGTVDEHTLMIYLSLLKRRVCSTVRSARREMLSTDGKEAAMARVQERNRSVSEEAEIRRRHSELVTMSPQQHQQFARVTRAASMDSGMIVPAVKSTSHSKSHEAGQTEWLSSETSSSFSGHDRSPTERANSLVSDTREVLMQTISEKVQEHIPSSEQEEDRDTDLQEQSERDTDEKETESMSEFSSGAIDEGYGTVRNESSVSKSVLSKENSKQNDQANGKSHQDNTSHYNSSRTLAENENEETNSERPEKIKIKRPRDYYLQWEETIDRLSHGPPDPPDVSDMSPRSPGQILHGISGFESPRSPSDYKGSDLFGGQYTPVWKRREYFEGRSSPRDSSRQSRQSKYLRSKSLPSETSHRNGEQTTDRQERFKRTQESENMSNGVKQKRSDGSVESQESERKYRRDDCDHEESSASVASYKSDFMARLGELQRSGRAQRVILPDLGPDAPVLMIPGQGKDVIMLFEALRQARLDVDTNMGHASRNSTDLSGRNRSPARRSPPQPSEETDLKKVINTDKVSAGVSRISPASEEEKDIVGSLPRPIPHHHRVPKSVDIRLDNLRSGGSRDPRRTKSLTERKAASQFGASSDSLRYHSLSPRRDHSLFEILEPERDVKDRSGSSEDSYKNRDTLHRSYRSSPPGHRSSPTLSPYRTVTGHESNYSIRSMHGISQKRSPRFGFGPERPPPLELPEDMVSPSSRVGGLGRVPRREAWERQQQRERTRPFQYRGADSQAQAKFIEVLCKEIEELKEKVEVMEDSQVNASPRRGSPRRETKSLEMTYTPTSTGENDIFYTAQSEIQETDNKMLLARKEDSSSNLSPKSRQSPRIRDSVRSSSTPLEASSRLKQSVSSFSPRRQYGKTSAAGKAWTRQSPSPNRFSGTYKERLSRSSTASRLSAVSGSRLSRSETADTNGVNTTQPVRSISLGYKSPIRSVTQEIWGRDLMDTEGLNPSQRENNTRLISQKSLAEGDVIELKQSLASSVVENDILHAKLKNAHHEIQEKLNKTNEVLDDCRRHLARSQAENMELRTFLERERERADRNEALANDLQLMVQQVRADNEELEEELDYTLDALDRSPPGYEALKEENAELFGRASVIQDENSSLKREMGDLRRSHVKSINTIRELRHLLDEIRGERSDLQQKVSQLERSNNETKVRSITNKYSQEKGAKDEVEQEFSSSGFSSSSERIKPSSQIHLSSAYDDEFPSKNLTSKLSTTLRSPSPGRNLNYSYEDTSPTVPSAYREIYPHRKPRYQSLSEKCSGSDRHDSPVTFIDYPDLQHYPTKLDHYDTDTDYSNGQHDEDGYRVVRSRDNSPIYKPIPFRPNSVDRVSYPYVQLSDRSSQSVREGGARSPATGGRSSTDRLSHSYRDPRSNSPSPLREYSKRRLNRSYDSAVFDRSDFRRTSRSPGHLGDVKRGILKSGTYTRERSPSPHYGSKSHSPPTRLSPEINKDKPARKKKLTFTRTEPGHVARNIQREFDKEDSFLDELRKKHTSMSWFELQFEHADCLSGDEPDDPGQFSREQQLLLSEEQRRYANTLIKKYTGLRA